MEARETPMFYQYVVITKCLRLVCIKKPLLFPLFQSKYITGKSYLLKVKERIVHTDLNVQQDCKEPYLKEIFEYFALSVNLISVLLHPWGEIKSKL